MKMKKSHNIPLIFSFSSRYEALLTSWLNSSGTDQNDSQTAMESTAMESTDMGTTLSVHIPQWNSSQVHSPGVDAEDVIRDGAAQEDDGMPLSEKLMKLKRQIAMDRQADHMEEIRLAQMLDI